jgi:hypothetical protein
VPRLSEVYESAGVERERRLQARRRLDRQEHVQWWLAVLLALWVLGQAATLSLTVIVLDLLRESQRSSDIVLAAFSANNSNDDPITSFIAAVALIFGLATLAIAALLAVVAFWNRRILPTGWFLAGVFPWLILIVETAAVMLLVLELK